VYPTGVTRPTASNLNFVPKVTVPNLVSVRLGRAGTRVCSTGRQTHVLFDVVAGYVAGDLPPALGSTRSPRLWSWTPGSPAVAESWPH